jgi:YD repeat-containing protein
MPIGLAMPWPAMSGADPCTGSNTDGKLPSGLILPDGALAMMTGAASAQQRTIYDSRGNVVGRSATDSSGATTNYDARGKVTSRETMTGKQSRSRF